MAHKADDIQQDIDNAQRDIDDTRLAMTEKLELLGERVWETVEGAQTSVEEMVENVRDTVDTTVTAVKQTVEGAQTSAEGMVENVRGTVRETVEAVQRTFDLHHQMEQHPWLMLSGSLFAGYLLGSRGGSSTFAAVSTHDLRLSPSGTTAASSSESSARPQPRQGMESNILDQFKDEIALIKGAVIGAVISTLHDIVKQVLSPPPPVPRTSAMSKQDGQPSDRPAQTPAAMSSPAINGNAIF